MKKFNHGLTGYVKHKCRCEICSAAKKSSAAKSYQKNKDKVSEKNRRYRNEHADEWREYRAEWGRKNVDKDREYGRRWRAKDIEHTRRLARERYYRRKSIDPGAIADARHRRRAREADSEGEHTSDEFDILVKMNGGRCLSCGIHSSSVKLQRDHIVPLSKGGSSGIDNIQPLCPKCNKSKGNRSSDDLRIWRFNENC